MSVRVRFAPSPTGHVHIGNIRAAIFNWLFARHERGQFLLRVEDTDRERSTPEAIASLLDVMAWLGLDYDEAPLYQTSQLAAHRAAAERLVAAGHAYRSAKGGAGEAIVFRIPVDGTGVPGLSELGPAQITVHPDAPVTIGPDGVGYALVSKKGTPAADTACLAGFRGLEVVDAGGACRFRLEDNLDAVLGAGRTFTVAGAVSLRFRRRQIQYADMVKGALAKPLDSMRDFVIVRSDGNPVFHLANVCDDVTQRITHIVRGDDHVENTYRHLFLFVALGAVPPCYAHLPMIVNQQGKPYSKRDGDAFVGDFRAKGYLPEALFNYLTLLGWSPGDGREKLTRQELIERFSLDRVQSAPAQMDVRKLENLNGQYMAELPGDTFADQCRAAAAALAWGRDLPADRFAAVARLMQSRTKTFGHVAQWEHFFGDLPVYDEKARTKFLTAPEVRAALQRLATTLDTVVFSAVELEAAVHAVTDAAGLERGRLNQPLRVAVTGSTVGAGIYETLEVLGRERSLARLRHALA